MVSATPANALFAILAVSHPMSLEPRIASISPWLSLKLKDGEWLVIAPASTTAKEVSDRLGITGVEPPVTSAVVLRADGYFGRSVPSTWEWIATKLGALLGTATV
jgi:hypothetical protein